MAVRPAPLQAFLDAAATAFAERTGGTPGAPVGRAVFAALAQVADGSVTAPAILPVVTRHLASLTAADRFDDPALARLAGAFADLSPHLNWTRRAGEAQNASAGFDEAHANAMIAGPGGLERRSDIWLGASLMAPNTRYPDHRHAPEEVYLTLSPGGFRQDGRDWTELGIGGTYYNPPGIEHMMRAGPEPFLALWALDATHDRP